MLRRGDLEKLQNLARLRLAPDEVESLLPQLERILAFVRRLEELDRWAASTTRGSPREPVRLRPDEPRPGAGTGSCLDCALDGADGLFRVPRVLDGEKA